MAQSRRALGLGIVAFLFVASTAQGNEWAAGIKTANNFDGVLGRQWIRTDPTHVTGVIFAHPVQMDIGPAGGDFVAIGTYKGAGTSSPGVPNCPSDYDAKWNVYRDGVLNGAYHCWILLADAYFAGDSPSFEIRLTLCSGVSKWVLWWDGIQRACIPSVLFASNVIVGIETAGTTTDYNIDAKYFNLYKNFTGSGTWFAFGNCDPPPSYADPNYAWDGTSDFACNTFLPPLD